MYYREIIQHYQPQQEQEACDRLEMLEVIETYGDLALDRACHLAHFTASSWIVNHEKTKVLMVFHRLYQSWSWTGGHADGDGNFLHVALKEAKEETGIEHVFPLQDTPISLEVICVNGHIKRGKYVTSHVHLNVTYLLEANEGDPLHIKEDENSSVQWVPIEEVCAYCSEPWMQNIYAKLNAYVKGEK